MKLNAVPPGNVVARSAEIRAPSRRATGATSISAIRAKRTVISLPSASTS
jgi:hypothetical protein